METAKQESGKKILNENEDLNKAKAIYFKEKTSNKEANEQEKTSKRQKSGQLLFWINQLHNQEPRGELPKNMLKFVQVFFEEFRCDPKEPRKLKVASCCYN
jgi:hypothetical protein